MITRLPFDVNKLKLGDRVRLGAYGDFQVEVTQIEQRLVPNNAPVHYFAFKGRFVEPTGELGNETPFYQHQVHQSSGIIRVV